MTSEDVSQSQCFGVILILAGCACEGFQIELTLCGCLSLLPPANEVCEGFVFTHVCLSTGKMVSQHDLQVVSQQFFRWGCVSHHALQVSRPTPKGELEGSDRGGVSRPTPRGVSRSTLRGGSPSPHPGGFPSPHLGISQHALRQTPPADSYCCRWYASYWNAFLLEKNECVVIGDFQMDQHHLM